MYMYSNIVVIYNNILLYIIVVYCYYLYVVS